MFVFTKLNNHLQNKRLSLTIFLAVLLLFNLAGAQSASKKPGGSLIHINVTKSTLLEVLTILKDQSEYDFFYDKVAAKKLTVENLKFTNASVMEVLKALRKLLPLDYQVLRNEVTVRIETEEQHNRRVKLEQPGKITGKVLDDKGGTLPGASVKVLELNRVIQSSTDGSYQFSLPAGIYTIEVSYVSYQSKRITEVLVKPGQNTPLDILLKTDAKSLVEVVVTASYRRASIEGLYARQKNNAAVSDGITAEQISRTPANNTAQVLAKVSGIQLSNDRSVVIRGLSDRYNNVLLNGAMVPSSEPNRRDFAFDMIPSALLDNIVVNKTATPDLTGEFTGGLVQVNTKGIPEENFLQLTVGSGLNTQATGKKSLGLDHGNRAWLSFGSDVHKKPEGLTFGQYNNLVGSIQNSTPTAEQRQQLNGFLGTMPDNWRMKQYTAQPVQNYQIQGGHVFPFKNNSRLGIVGALTYRNEQRADEKSLFQINGLDYSGIQYKYLTTLGGSLNAGYDFGKNKITLQNTYNRKFSDDLWRYDGTDEDNGSSIVSNYNNVTVINALFQSQLGGEHLIGNRGIKLDWNVSVADLDRSQPYSRIMARSRQIGEPEEYFGYDLTDSRLRGGSLFYSNLKENLYNWGTNLQVPFEWLGRNQSFKMGYQGKYRKADFSSSLYRMFSFSGASYQGLPYYDVYNRTNFTGDLYLKPVSTNGQDLSSNSATEGYDGFQRLHSFYGMVDLKPLEKLRVIGGIRAEKNDQNVFDRVYVPASQSYERKQTGIQQTDWLPSVNVVYSVTEQINIRAAWYKTVARPDLRELSSFQYFDYDLFDIISGTPLKTTKIENADLRLEYYPAPGEIISVSGFYKNFKNPIEVLYLPADNLYYTNLLKAKDLGLEVDFRKSLNFINSSSSFLQQLYIAGNFTLLDASIEFDPLTAVDEKGNVVPSKRNRPLAGQSPYIINGGLNYVGKKFGANIMYNRYGKRVVYASPSRAVDQYENPRNMIDLQLSYKFLKKEKAEFRLNVSNLLNQEQFIYINQFSPGNRFGFDGGTKSVEEYPGTGEVVPADQLDPKGTSYNKDYDTKIRRNKFGATYTLNFIYRF